VGLDAAIAQFDGEGTAVNQYAAAKQQGDPAWTQKVGFIERHHSGRLLMRGTFAGHYLDIDESDHVSQRGAGEGVVAGGLIGALLGPPGIAVGIVVGGLTGAETGKEPDVEAEPAALAERLRDAVPKSSSAIVLIAEASDVDEMVAALGDSAHSMSRRTLTGEEEAGLQAALSETPRAQPGEF
jgi:uncharacterized membrane protein